MNLFDFFRDPNLYWVLIGVTLMCSSAALVGTFTFLRKRALIGDAIAHAILPGVCLAFLFAQSKHPLVLLLGAVISGWLGILSINAIERNTKIKSDAALALVLSVFYGLGIVLLTMIQGSGNAAQAGLDKFLFGQAAAMLPSDIQAFGIFSVLLIICLILFFPAFKLIVFDREYALTRGLPVKRLELLLSILTVLSIALGIQAVGVVLMSALLIAPAATARYWTNKLSVLMLVAVLVAIASGLAGAFISYSRPRMPTGPWIVSVMSFFAVASVFVGKERGLLAKQLKRRRQQAKMLRENILKCLYQLGEKDGQLLSPRSMEEIQSRRFIEGKKLKRGIQELRQEELISTSNGWPALTQKGIEEGKRIVRIHRLWELYLTKFMKLPADHVHDDAEAIEHIITPEIEKELEYYLAYPDKDPHESPIPYE